VLFNRRPHWLVVIWSGVQIGQASAIKGGISAAEAELAKSGDEYTDEEMVLYCDPTYVGKEGYYPVSDIDYAEFVSA